jgi:hypothetical protein
MGIEEGGADVGPAEGDGRPPNDESMAEYEDGDGPGEVGLDNLLFLRLFPVAADTAAEAYGSYRFPRFSRMVAAPPLSSCVLREPGKREAGISMSSPSPL